MKKALLTPLAALLLVGCVDTEFLGTEEAQHTVNGDKPILFTSESAPMTRADITGSKAAELLGENYVVMGSKSDGTTVNQQVVFNHYNINYYSGTAGSTETNVADWEYVGMDPHANAFKGAGALPTGAKQFIKYWDFSASQYDFAAFSYGKLKVKKNLTLSQIDLKKIGNDGVASGKTDPVYTVTGKVSNLVKAYVSDLVTVPKADYNKTVTPKFRQMASKVRIAIYETVAGYAVKDVKFYYGNNRSKESLMDDNTTPKPVLYAVKQVTNTTTSKVHLVPTDVLPNLSGNGTVNVYYPTVGTPSSTDNNKVHVKFTGAAATDLTSKLEFSPLNYASLTEGYISGNFIGQTSNTATYATTSDAASAYEMVLPYGAGTDLKLHVDYTLVSVDGSGEEIHVYDASALVPAVYTNWQPNYAYTYIFKISKNSNGTTGGPGTSGTGDPDDPTNPGDDPTDPDTPDPNNPAGLYPITFDAVVMDFDNEHVQETITTVATPSITTYSKGVQPTANSEYLKDNNIYVSVKNASSDIALTSANAKLYTATVETGALQGIDENSIANALMNGDATTSGTWIVTDAAGKKLTVTSAASVALSFPTEIAAADAPDGNAVAGNFAKFTPSAAGIYVFEYSSATPEYYSTASEYNTDKGTSLTDAAFAALPQSQKLKKTVNFYKIIIVH